MRSVFGGGLVRTKKPNGSLNLVAIFLAWLKVGFLVPSSHEWTTGS
jgi:hypothetical protein